MSESENSAVVSDKEEEMKEEEEVQEKKDESMEEEKESKPSPTKSPKKKEEESENEESDDEESDDEDEPQGLLDKPVVVEGKRERKKTDRIEIAVTSPKTESLVIPEGKGEKLGDCPRIEHFLSKHKAEDLKPLHRVLFNKVGKATEVKKNIRKFCGFTFEKDSPEYKKKVDSLNKLTMAQLKNICETIDIERGGPKPEVIERMMDFLQNPKGSDKALPQKKGRGRAKASGDKVTKKRKRKTKEGGETKKASKKKAAVENDEVELSPDSDSDEEEVKDKSEDEKEEEEEEPKKKKAKTETPKKPKKKPAAKKEKKEKKEKKTPTPKKKKAAPPPSDDSDDGSTSDEEPLVKQAKKPPGDDELKEVVRKILDGANLEEITMKTVCKQVYAKYPDFDLTDKKDFIKSTVRNIIQ